IVFTAGRRFSGLSVDSGPQPRQIPAIQDSNRGGVELGAPHRDSNSGRGERDKPPNYPQERGVCTFQQQKPICFTRERSLVRAQPCPFWKALDFHGFLLL